MVRSLVKSWGLALVFVCAVVLTQGCGTSDSTDAGLDALNPTTTAALSDNQLVPFRDRVPVLPSEPFDYGADLPAHFRTGADGGVAALDPTQGTRDNNVATLGRVLFYDVNLSASRSVRCASCHVQSASFTDPQQLSLGVRGETDRHSMSLANATFTADDRFFWDLRADSLEQQIEEAITGPIEMAVPLPLLVERVEERDFYAPLFAEAYGDPNISDERIIGALTHFVRTMVTSSSRYDEGRQQVASGTDPFPNFTDEENLGRMLFLAPIAEGGGSCANCHSGEAQVLSGARNNGLSADDVDRFGRLDRGLFRATGLDTDRGLFRSPSLRNVADTGPYMHDARFFNLRDVVEHYNTGISDHPNLDPELRDANGEPVRLGWSDEQVDAVVAFLETLTDKSFLTDPRFSDPFR